MGVPGWAERKGTQRAASAIVSTSLLHSFTTILLQRNVGQVGNLRPIVNRPARGGKQALERFRSGRLVAAMLPCAAGWHPAADWGRPLGPAMVVAKLLPLPIGTRPLCRSCERMVRAPPMVQALPRISTYSSLRARRFGRFCWTHRQRADHLIHRLLNGYVHDAILLVNT